MSHILRTNIIHVTDPLDNPSRGTPNVTGNQTDPLLNLRVGRELESTPAKNVAGSSLGRVSRSTPWLREKDGTT